jgi:hypothetical protein
MKLLRDIFTGKDNTTYDLGRISWALSVIWFLSASTYNMVITSTFDMIAAGTGLGGILAAGGAALALKSGDEPNAKSD